MSTAQMSTGMDAEMDAAAMKAAPARARARRLRAWFEPLVSTGMREQRDQAVLLLAVAVAVTPHFHHLSSWSIAVLGGLWAWRAWLTLRLKPAPGRGLVLPLLLLLTAAVWSEHGTLWGRDASVHFLLMLVGLKILEMRARRDVFVIAFLSLFVLETQFLFDQGPLTAVLMLVAVGLLFFVLLGVSLPVGDLSVRSKLRYLGRIFLLALPLTLSMFFLFPRLPIPLWNAFNDEPQSGVTGLSDSMRPGSIGNLLRDDSVALRAKFAGGIPAQSSLYWRGPVFGYFDGNTWLPVEAAPTASLEAQDITYDPRSGVDYTVTLEPTQRRELIGLEFAAQVDGVPTVQGRLTATLQLRSMTPVSGRRRYQVRSYTSFTLEPKARLETLSDWLQLPPQSNPRTRLLASELQSRIRAADTAGPAKAQSPPRDQRLVDAVLTYFRREPFRYSLQPGIQRGADAIDEFLFDTQVGYCEHYASSFVFLMRVLGIPARVVTGYQGGEINPVDGFLTVRASDAHAWAEVWIPERGWVRVDPTAAVAPERVERSLHEPPGADAARGRAALPWLHRWRLDREALENAWNQWFLSYSSERQRALVARLGLRPNARNIAFVAIGTFSLLLALLTLVSLRHAVRRDPLAELVVQLRRKLARAGVEVPASMGLQDMEHHLAGCLEPHSLAEALGLLRALSSARYARHSVRERAAAAARARARLRHWQPLRA